MLTALLPILSVLQKRAPSFKVSLRDCPMGPGPRPRELVIRLPCRKVSYFAKSDAQFQVWRAALSASSGRVSSLSSALQRVPTALF